MCELRRINKALDSDAISGEDRSLVASLEESLIEQSASAPALDALEQSDLEEELASWLDRNEIPDASRLASGLVEAGVDCAALDEARRKVPGRGSSARSGARRIVGRRRKADAGNRSQHRANFRTGARHQGIFLHGPGARAGGRRASRHREHPDHARVPAQARRGGEARVRHFPAPHLRARQRIEPGLDQPDRQRHRRDGRQGRTDRANFPRPRFVLGRNHRQRPRHSRRRASPASSSRSLRPRASAKAPESVSIRCIGSCARITAKSRSTPNPAEPAFRCDCRSSPNRDQAE